jgi:hypothetical protein
LLSFPSAAFSSDSLSTWNNAYGRLHDSSQRSI